MKFANDKIHAFFARFALDDAPFFRNAAQAPQPFAALIHRQKAFFLYSGMRVCESKEASRNSVQRGPHRVLVGDLSYAGINGKVYTPAEGKGLPAVAFAHDWTKKVKNYHATLRRFGRSWGIVVVAPDTETGLVPNHRNLAADLESSLQIAAGVKLGTGKIAVSPSKLGVVGHGMGGGVAALTAVDNPKIRAVAAIYPADTAPSSYAAARSITAPALILGSEREDLFRAGNPAEAGKQLGRQGRLPRARQGNTGWFH